jgi:hypothetical protein
MIHTLVDPALQLRYVDCHIDPPTCLRLPNKRWILLLLRRVPRKFLFVLQVSARVISASKRDENLVRG